MKKLLGQIDKLKNSEVKDTIDLRLAEFESLGRKSSRELFKELCFCILTANFRADRSIYVQKEIGSGFLVLSKAQLAGKLKELGCRFHTNKAGYIVEARKHADSIKNTAGLFENPVEFREWLVKNVRGIGYKEASHYLRNTGHNDVAIIDFHIIDILAEYGLVDRQKTMTKKRYFEIENILKKLSAKAGLALGELDLYLWYMETGTVLK